MNVPKPHEIASLAGVIFDLDGTLVDSALDFAAIRRQLGIEDQVGLIEHMHSLPDPRERARVRAAIHAFEMEGANRAIWMPGANELLVALSQRRMPVAILTRNMREAVQRMAEKLNIPVTQILTREDCRPKPDPDGLEQIARAWGVPPERLVYIGDFKFDLEAAKNAGMRSCLYRNERNGEWATMADWVIDHFDQLRNLLP